MHIRHLLREIYPLSNLVQRHLLHPSSFIHLPMPCQTIRHVWRRRCRRCLILPIAVTLAALVLFIVFSLTQKNLLVRTQPTASIARRTLIIIRTSHHCQSRLTYLLRSWIPSNLNEQGHVYLLTDKRSKYSNRTILQSFRNVIDTNCSETHDRFDLCCKTAHEFELFKNLSRVHRELEWMCRFDDDQYVNLPNLYELLAEKDASKRHYIGRTSSQHPMTVPERNGTYFFATYGGGVCFSRPLLERMQPYVGKQLLPDDCVARRLSDDVYIGYLTELVLNTRLLTLNKRFHSHLEKLDVSFRTFHLAYLRQAITLGFAWDRYTLNWLPIIHQLLELSRRGESEAADHLWTFLRRYEKEHPEDLRDKHDDSCSSYRSKRDPLIQPHIEFTRATTTSNRS